MGDQESEVEELERRLNDADADPMKIPYAVIKTITKNFAQVIGHGGFGVVYLGGLRNGMVAVKKLSTLKDISDKQFLDEVSCLQKAKHKNIVRFLGYCADTQGEVMDVQGKLRIVEVQQRLLCFEYVPNGNLNHYLKAEKGLGCEWSVCYQIIRGICQGLHYLHQERITHLDLKPENVLLDAHMEPKITDFGLSRFIDEKQSKIFATHVYGTLGYMAPEYIDKGEISLKADIFSLGTIMKRLLTGSNDSITENWHESLDLECPQIKKCIEIVQICVDRDPRNRPSIDKIIFMLHKIETMIQMVPPVTNVPRNDPKSSLYKVVQRFRSLPERTLCEYSRMVDIYKELNVLEHILEGNEKPCNLSYPLLQFITENFSFERRIDHNEFEENFKGILQSVNVTRLSGSLNITDGMFHRQVENMMLAQHQNIIRFLGYCSYAAEQEVHIDGKIVIAEKRERFLCFEYLRNGNLKRHLSDELRGLEWHTRYLIIRGICEGLCYLHKEKDIIHMDLKPASILLDDHMVPKITHFSISELIIMSNERLQRLGYSAPECMFSGAVSRKSDIYSLGVVIIELVTGTREKPIINKVLRRWKHRWNKSAKHSPLGYQQVTKCLELAQSCLHKDPSRRPVIWDIIRVLNELDNDANVSKFDRIISCLEDMLGIRPLELRFSFEHNKCTTRAVELINDTNDHFAFKITASSSLPCSIQPSKDVVLPGSKSRVTITLQPLEMAPLLHGYGVPQFTVQSTRVAKSVVGEDIIEDMFDEKPGKVVDTVDLIVVHD